MLRRKRKKSAVCVGDGELRVDGESVMHFRSLNGILGISLHGGFQALVSVNDSLVCSRTKFKH